MDRRVLVLAPRGRDAAIAADLLSKNAIDPVVCASTMDLLDALRVGAGAVLITEEALARGDQHALTAWTTSQPSWSDLPFIVLANGGKAPRSALATKRLTDLGNVVLLERPLHAEAMLGAVRSALKARARQFEVQAAAATLERTVVDRTRELEAARSSLEIALEAAGMGTWDLDLLTGESRRSQRHDEIFGYPERRPIWRLETFIEHVVRSQRADIQIVFERALTSGALDLECTIVRADGATRYIVSKGRVRYDNGQPVGIAGVISDVTDRKEADAQLAQAHKMDAIGQLTGGVAHDFNNLLTPIVGSLDMVRRRHKDDERTQKMVAGAMQAAERAATLTQRLLAFARRQALQPKAVDVAALIDGIVDLIRRSLGPTIDVVLDVPSNLPSARIDPNQLELALLNLAINARDAMPGGGRLTLAARFFEIDGVHALGLSSGHYVRLSAIDTGTGMDAATLARATEPFFSTKGVGKGTGLGLSMIHGLAAQSGGTLNLTSTPGKGTSVEMWLPATRDIAETASSDVVEPIAAHSAATVMLVDDEELVRSATADMLRDLGYSVVEFGSASQAIAAVQSGTEADALVSDYLMPGMTGGALICELRISPFKIPSLLVTGYAAAGEDVPADVARLAKPFRQVDLARRLDELIRSSTVRKPHLRAM
ncbi:hybrid sensor histidine kinase/response regulator [Sphingomonas nostoxanthinifaciens]|uniref:hybrid sensor histidine kinase/response regulator n=1 Tax=Sphingomonas nostoxanthinifaciens TaxID=2872652 RepID=UPI001CC1FD25|nr:PAS domain-containing sensor histidine kinase [Sphingomonas nostoxanthinifaciens]UAK25702.1 response regulator [Sphingomonas nostoxanthinifaciens]